MDTRGKPLGGLFSRFHNLASLSHCPDHRGLTAASHLHPSCIIRSGSPPPPGVGRPWRAFFLTKGSLFQDVALGWLDNYMATASDKI
eukprot:7027305-Pyramimonas_sp.AAC.1